MAFESFCGHSLWDPEILYNSNRPIFSPCLTETVALWFSSGFLWVGAPVAVYGAFKASKPKLPYTKRLIIKLTASLALCVLTLYELVSVMLRSSNGSDIYPYQIVSSAIRLISFCMTTILLIVYQRKGVHSSGLLFVYWLLMALTMSTNYWTLIDSNNKRHRKHWTFDAEDFTIRTIQLSLIWILLVFNCFVDTRKTFISIDKQTIQIESPYESASFLSHLLFTWYDSMALLGFKRTLTSSDIWPLPSEYKSNPIDFEFRRLLAAGTKYTVTESSKASKAKDGQIEKLDLKATKTMKLSLLNILLKGFWPYFVLSGLFKLVSSVLIFSNPLFMDYLLTFVKATDKPAWHGIFIALGMFVITFISSIFDAHYEFLIQTTSMKIKSALIASVYQKTLRLSSAARQSYTTGEIINLMAVDLDRIVEYVNIMNYLWFPPIQLIIAVIFLWRQLGVASIAGLAVVIILIPCNGYVAHRLEVLEDKILTEKDKRSKLMSEILNGMKVLKLYAWEGAFGNRVTAIRARELKYQRSDAFWETGIYFAFNCLPFLMNVVNFATFALLSSDNILDANKAFVSITLIGTVQDPIAFLPMVIAYGANFVTSLRRVNEFLQCDELDPNTIDHEPSHEIPIIVKNATFCWSHDDEPIIKRLSLSVERNKLVAIVGTIGSGKSSLLSALLGELYKKEGSVNVHGRIAYVPQSAWIQNATVRDNILFGEPYEKEKYESIIEACALTSDLKILPGNDQTEIGERGINVSGGQKQRISIARAVYSDTDIYLLDDPLSAVDSHVATHLFDRVIGPNGLLRNKTRVFVTHRLTFLPQVDEIIVLKDGEIYDHGSFDELMDKKGSFAEFIDQFMCEIEEDDEDLIEKESTSIVKPPSDKITRMGSIRSVESESRLVRTLSTFKRSSISNIGTTHVQKKEKVPKKEPEESKFKLIEDEEAEQGSIKMKVYLDYFSAIGWLAVLAVIAFYLCVSVLDFGTNLWLSAWADDASIPNSSNNTALRHKRLGVYAALGLGNAVSVLASVIICNLAVLKGATLIHNQMLNRIIRAPMFFFDTTPAGRILNRFSKDIDIADSVIGHEFQLFFSQFFRLIVAIIGIVTGSIYLLIVLLILGFVYIFIQKIYIASSRQLRRITSITESPIYSHFAETINGASSIRAFKSSARFIEECCNRVDTSNRSFFLSIGASRWLSVRLEFLGNIVVTLAVILVVSARDSLSAGEAGLSISYSFEITSLLSYLIMSISNIETNIVSIERCLEFTRIATEAAWKNENKRPSQRWPDRGQIVFRDYSTRYRPGLDLVLKNIGFTIHPREKVGIVGRTGAGKSSLTLSLFRLIEPANGMIIIDGQDITQFGLHDLRSRLTVIPQDPVLFSASFRSNFDPFQKHSDEEIWTALEQANLKQFVVNLENGLDYEISEGGENLSVGQRQLVCLTRALLRKTKILVLDEATAAVDVETDELIQETIRREFADCTIVTIAHRLNTIMDYDKIMVMAKGNIIEYDSPSNLLANEETEFYSMARDAKLV